MAVRVGLEPTERLHVRWFSRRDFLLISKVANFSLVYKNMFNVENFYKARELKIRILEKEATFSDMAISYSNGFEKKSGGLIGPTSLINAHSSLIDILRTSKEGDITGPHIIEKWFVVVRLEKFTPAKLDEVTHKKMAQELFEEWVNEAVDEMHNAIIKTNNSSF